MSVDHCGENSAVIKAINMMHGRAEHLDDIHDSMNTVSTSNLGRWADGILSMLRSHLLRKR